VSFPQPRGGFAMLTAVVADDRTGDHRPDKSRKLAYKSALSMGAPEPGEDQKGSAMAQTSSASEGVPNDEALATASAGREEMASKLVHRFALWSGVAGLVPLPVVDVIAVGGLQVQMLTPLLG
jgi:hypothetical protein